MHLPTSSQSWITLTFFLPRSCQVLRGLLSSQYGLANILLWTADLRHRLMLTDFPCSQQEPRPPTSPRNWRLGGTQSLTFSPSNSTLSTYTTSPSSFSPFLSFSLISESFFFSAFPSGQPSHELQSPWERFLSPLIFSRTLFHQLSGFACPQIPLHYCCFFSAEEPRKFLILNTSTSPNL